jgi:uncharacterized protein YdaU (DUF1376 family)
MAERWQQWMPFHIDRFRGSTDVQAMHPAARLGYLYLLASAWQTDDCTIADDPLELASASGLGDELWATHSVRIMRKFVTCEVAGRLRNSVVYQEWNEAKRIFEERQLTPEQRTELSEQRKAAGIKGNLKRWGEHHRKTSQLAINPDKDAGGIDDDGEVKLATIAKTSQLATTPSQTNRNLRLDDRKPIANDRLTGTVTVTREVLNSLTSHQKTDGRLSARADASSSENVASEATATRERWSPEQYRSYWNSNCSPLSKVRRLTPKRQSKLVHRMAGGLTPELFEMVVARLKASPFCRGENDSSWRAEFDFVIQNDTNFLKILEGRYDRAMKPKAPVISMPTNRMSADYKIAEASDDNKNDDDDDRADG